MELAPIFKKAYWSLAFCGLIYVLAIFSLTYPVIQRGVLYANKINPTKFYDIHDVESFGFLKSQVQPFNIITPDNETLHAWHVLPLHLYKKHEASLLANSPPGVADDVRKTPAYKILADDPNARVVVNLHGNAAHLAAGYRPNIYRNFASISTPDRPVHVIAMDYRGFGESTGTPTEEGLITDAHAMITYLTSPPLSISPSRIVVAGQSLGTGVTAGLAERLAFSRTSTPMTLAGYMLVAPFSNIPTLLESYHMGGILPPIFSPLIGYPSYKKYILKHILDRWDTAARLARLTGVAPKTEADKGLPELDFTLTVLHAKNDHDIPWREGNRAWAAAVGGSKASHYGKFVEESASEDGAEVKVWERKVGSKIKKVRWERVRYGMHNEIASLSPAAIALARLFDGK